MKVLKTISFLLILFLVGCSKEKMMTCTLNINNNLGNYTATEVYKVYYKGDFVTLIKKNEKYVSDDQNTIEYFYDAKKLEYYDLNDKYGGVTYEVNKSDKDVSLIASISMDLFNITAMAKDGRIDKDYVLSNKLTLNGLKKIYAKKGFVCNE